MGPPYCWRRRSREKPNMNKRSLLQAVALGATVAVTSSSSLLAQVALSGKVTSAEEGAMEGVLVSAKKEGGTITITVVSDATGQFSFPASKLGPGKYAISIRAIGYDLQGPQSVEFAGDKGATADIKLVKTKNISRQLSNGEWIMSVPGNQQQKLSLLNCVSCHTLERIVKSSYDADTFATQILPRMGSYANQSVPMHAQKRIATRLLEERGDSLAQARKRQADFLSSINLGSSAWEYELKTLPRPKGNGTKVIYTEYDLPRPTIEPHDVVIGADGNAYYSNFGEQTFGSIDPKTGAHSEIAMPDLKKGWPTGMLGLRPDK